MDPLSCPKDPDDAIQLPPSPQLEEPKSPSVKPQCHLTSPIPLEEGALCPLQKAARAKERGAHRRERVPIRNTLSPQRTAVLEVEEAAATLEKRFMKDFLTLEDNNNDILEHQESISVEYENGYEDDLDDDDEYEEEISKETTESLNNANTSKLTRKHKTSDYNYHFRHDWVDKLMPEEVRWFYRDQTEKKKWNPFIGYDSLRIETKYQELKQNGCPQCEERLKRKINSYNGDVTVDPSEQDSVLNPGSMAIVDKLKFLRQAHVFLDDERQENEPCMENVIVRGGLFEVNVVQRKMTPIYWSGVLHTSTVIRGTWFKVDTEEPFEEELAEQIEAEHLKQFEGIKFSEPPQPPPSVEKHRQPIHTMKFPEFHLDWYTLEEIYLYVESTSHFIRQRLGLQKVGTRLRRGYQHTASMADKPPDITRLCFVIHGIGQKMLTGAIIKSCSDLRENCERIRQKFFPDLSGANQRVEFLPVEWRSSLRLDGDTVNSITPSHLSSLRTLLNSSAMDILYYTSPLYRAEIIYGLQSELNRLYSMFCARHPYFEATGGKVNIVAHSLGTVITYDILMGGSLSVRNVVQEANMKSNNQPGEIASEFSQCLKELESVRTKMSELEMKLMHLAGNNVDHAAQASITFRLENFFCLGSPLAVFIALRGVRPRDTGSLQHILPPNVCQRIFNMYHPFDPVAYRIEPLILKHYATIHPVIIHRWDARSKPSYHNMLPELISSGKPVKKSTDSRKEFQVPEKETLSAARRTFGSKNALCPLEDERVRFQKSLSHPDQIGLDEDSLSDSATACGEGRCSNDEMDTNSLSLTQVKAPGKSSFGSRLQSFFSRSRASTPCHGTTSATVSPQHLSRISEAGLEASAASGVSVSTRNLNTNRGILEAELECFGSGQSLRCEHLVDPAAYHHHLQHRNIAEKLLQESSKSVEYSLGVGGDEMRENSAQELSPGVPSRLERQVSMKSSLSTDSGTTTFDPYQAGQEQTHLEHRIDYQLRESRYESSYLSVLTSHMAYWTNPDVAMFIMTHLFSDYGPIGIPKL